MSTPNHSQHCQHPALPEQHLEQDLDCLHKDGYTILPQVLSAAECQQAAEQIVAALQSSTGAAIEARQSPAVSTQHNSHLKPQAAVVGGRNLLHSWNGWKALLRKPAVVRLLRSQLGADAGLVRILFFDKPPGKGWSLAMHQDRTIAVRRHCDPLTPFSKPTTKAGVPHVEATRSLLSQMLTLRFHLDAMHSANGPLIVSPGSHRDRGGDAKEIHCRAGDVFAMRPLLSHGSIAAAADTSDHRRVIHLEFAPRPDLPGDFQWHDFEPLEQRV